jgi:membrane protease YdiL (CAAX protease family)
MFRDARDYLSATRHPWPCLWFLLPLLAAYEGGIFWLGGAHSEAIRNGADTWLHWGLDTFGFHELYWGPILIAALFVIWSWWRLNDRPLDLMGICLGMAIESVFFALVLWGLSRELSPLLESFGVSLNASPQTDPASVQVISFVGAGIYEEVLFRLLLFSGLVWLLKQIHVSGAFAVILAAAGSALIFSWAHHFGPHGEQYDAYVFTFRTIAGIYFALLFRLRGFGIAVGAHALYDVLVGVLLNQV